MNQFDINRHVPYLRRFARALTGSQPAGDACVARMLKGLLAGDVALDTRIDPRLSLFQAFFATWKRGSDGMTVLEAPDGDQLGQRLQILVPTERVAYLLAAVEGFSLAEAASITGQGEADLREYVANAAGRLDRSLATDVVIIEDEWVVARHLKQIVEGMGHRVVSLAGRGDIGLAEARRLRPGLVLADINLETPEAGIETVNAIVDEFPVPAVFVTAYPEMLLSGRGPEPTYLVAKPFHDHAIRAIVSQALFFQPVDCRAS